MHNVNWWLMAISFVLGLLLTFAFMIRRVKREVPITAGYRGGGEPSAKFAGAAAGEQPYGAGSARVAAGGGGPSGWRIKGHEGSMLYHTPDSPNYNQVVHDVWFKDEDSARRAGFTHWGKGGKLAAGAAAAAAGGVAAAKLAGRKGDGHEEPYGAGSARVAAGGGGPSGWRIKGNEDSMLYHTPDSPNYEQTIAELWFKDEESAQRAGFTHWGKAGPYGAGSAKAGTGGSGPPGWTIKGNEQSMLYHTPDSPNYKQTIAELWFKDEESAQRAGFTHWGKGEHH